MTDLPTAADMSPEAKAIRKIELEQLNKKCDAALGRSHVTPLFTEKNLSKETKSALAATEPKKSTPLDHLYKISPEMEKKLQNFDQVLKERPAPHYQTGPVDPVTRLQAYHRALGTPKNIVDFEVAELKKQLEGKA